MSGFKISYLNHDRKYFYQINQTDQQNKQRHPVSYTHLDVYKRQGFDGVSEYDKDGNYVGPMPDNDGTSSGDTSEEDSEEDSSDTNTDSSDEDTESYSDEESDGWDQGDTDEESLSLIHI